jgi:DNA polymerase III epsilon subunit-like protein
VTESFADPLPDPRPETFISVDLEASGPIPAEYSILSIGACLVDDPDTAFYVELKPEHPAVNERALAISGLDMAVLARDGVDPSEALHRFAHWIDRVVPEGSAPVFVAFNAAFDWMFLEDAFQRHVGRNPFGHSALDVKAYYMGMAGATWAETSMRYLSPRYLGGRQLTHNALGDARDQAELFRAVLAEAEERRRP